MAAGVEGLDGSSSFGGGMKIFRGSERRKDILDLLKMVSHLLVTSHHSLSNPSPTT
jgi:hypothetical protein